MLARHRRLAGDQVRFQTGTDDNSLKNVLAAEAEARRDRDYPAPGSRTWSMPSVTRLSNTG